MIFRHLRQEGDNQRYYSCQITSKLLKFIIIMVKAPKPSQTFFLTYSFQLTYKNWKGGTAFLKIKYSHIFLKSWREFFSWYNANCEGVLAWTKIQSMLRLDLWHLSGCHKNNELSLDNHKIWQFSEIAMMR